MKKVVQVEIKPILVMQIKTFRENQKMGMSTQIWGLRQMKGRQTYKFYCDVNKKKVSLVGNLLCRYKI